MENISHFKENTTWHFAIEWRLLVNMNFLAKITCMLELCQLIWTDSESIKRDMWQCHTHTPLTKYARGFNPIVYLFDVCFASIGYLFVSSWFSIDTFDRINYLHARKWKRNQNSTIQTFSQNINIKIHFHHLVTIFRRLLLLLSSFPSFFLRFEMSFAITTM